MKRWANLNKRIIIQKVTETQDGYGQPTQSWSDYKKVWADVIPKRGREYFNNPELVSSSEIIFRILFLSSITTKMRINYDGNNYDIVSIIEIGFRQGLEIVAILNEG